MITQQVNTLSAEKRVNENLGLVFRLAKSRYLRLCKLGILTISENELISAAYLGLSEAGIKFDETRNNDFTGFACYHIDLAIKAYQRELDVLPHRHRADLKAVRNQESLLAQKFGRQPSNSEIAERLKKSQAQIDSTNVQIDSFEELNRLVPNEDGFDRPDNSDSPDKQFENSEREKRLADDMENCLKSSLNDTQRNIMELKYFEKKKVSEISMSLWSEFDDKLKTKIYNIVKAAKKKLSVCLSKKGWSINNMNQKNKWSED